MDNQTALRVIRQLRADSYKLFPSDQLDELQPALKIACTRIKLDGDPVLDAYDEVKKEYPNYKFEMCSFNFNISDFYPNLSENSKLGDEFRAKLDISKIQELVKEEVIRQMKEFISPIEPTDKIFDCK